MSSGYSTLQLLMMLQNIEASFEFQIHFILLLVKKRSVNMKYDHV